jgi:hypothetical protein
MLKMAFANVTKWTGYVAPDFNFHATKLAKKAYN